MASDLTAERLREVLHYDPETGVFTWRIDTNRRGDHGNAGGRAGGLDAKGYVRITVDGCSVRAHRLAVLYVTGSKAPGMVDHINGDRTDNRWANLRIATPSGNAQNRRRATTGSTSGLLGAHRARQRWRAHIGIDGRNIHLGTYDTAAEAHAAYVRAKRVLHPFGML